ncbi:MULTISPECIES: hypothetical protein, partial [unclassified Rhizobium]|uniref:hypothetical protein n=1 Tax=unclassified Rhizobium TaxID=2613769 RepID=UPI001FFE0055
VEQKPTAHSGNSYGITQLSARSAGGAGQARCSLREPTMEAAGHEYRELVATDTENPIQTGCSQ